MYVQDSKLDIILYLPKNDISGVCEEISKFGFMSYIYTFTATP